MVGEWVYHITVLLWQNCITLNFGWLAITGVAGHLAIISQNVRDGEQNLLWVINLIYSAHNDRGVGLPYYRPFMAKLHYIEFWVTSYNRGGWQLKQFFLNTFAMERRTFYGFLISYKVSTMVGEWVYHIAVLFWQNCITLNFGWLAITGVAGHLSNYFSKCSRWRAKPFMGN